MENIENRFSTVEEYVENLITENQIRKEKVKVEDDFIVIDYYFKIDGSKVIENLDWSCIVARSACVTNNTKAISNWENLPKTINGISGELPNCSSLESYLQKNAAGRYENKDGKFMVKGNITIFNAAFDLSSLYVDGNVLWRDQKEVAYKKLPHASRILGLSSQKIKKEKDDKINYRDAHAKGLCDNICQELGAPRTNTLVEFFKKIKSCCK